MEWPIADFGEIHSSECRHAQRQICAQCVQQHTYHAFADDPRAAIRCPENGCQALFDFDSVQRILSSSNPNISGCKSAMLKRENQLTMDSIDQMPNFVWCAYGCEWGSIIDEGDILLCKHCHKKTCKHHRTQWHAGMTCGEYDQKLKLNQQEDHNQAWLKKNTKKCPKCKTNIEKNDGCEHMTCIQCKYEFCWLCLADYDLIRKNDNRWHASHCPHYA